MTPYIQQRAPKVNNGIAVVDNDTSLHVEGKAFRNEICARV